MIQRKIGFFSLSLSLSLLHSCTYLISWFDRLQLRTSWYQIALFELFCTASFTAKVIVHQWIFGNCPRKSFSNWFPLARTLEDPSHSDVWKDLSWYILRYRFAKNQSLTFSWPRKGGRKARSDEPSGDYHRKSFWTTVFWMYLASWTTCMTETHGKFSLDFVVADIFNTSLLFFLG